MINSRSNSIYRVKKKHKLYFINRFHKKWNVIYFNCLSIRTIYKIENRINKEFFRYMVFIAYYKIGQGDGGLSECTLYLKND